VDNVVDNHLCVGCNIVDNVVDNVVDNLWIITYEFDTSSYLGSSELPRKTCEYQNVNKIK
jgi:hypothetical protein